ncbi:MAG: DNA primase [Bacteroidota bacterium]|nr:DNA primase [Bacteroidota bacterium]
MRQDREVIDEIRRASDLLEVVQHYSQVKLKKRGRNWLGLCPFHNERTPSFNVDPERGYYKCFGCGKSGDVYAFVMEINGLTFGEALRTLARRANIPLPERSRDRSEERRRDPLFNALRFAADFFEIQLNESQKAQEFLKARQFTPETTQRFRLGYAPDAWRGLLESATRHHISADTLLAAGLVKKSEKGRIYDAFRDRIVFPIWSSGNRIVGFGGRRLSADKHVPKYLNSPETDVYHKSVVLYGLEKSRSAIRQQGEAILVEGYTDVLALHQAGVENVVAGCGTALTGTQIKILGRYTKTLVLIYDADPAGIAAAEKALDLVLGNGLTPYVVSLPKGADPDSFVRDQGADRFQELIEDQRMDFVRFLHRKAQVIGQLTTPEGRTASIKDVLAKIDLIQDQVLSNEYLNLASDCYDIPVDQLARWKQRPPVQPTQLPSATFNSPDMQLLDIMLQYGAPVIRLVFGYLESEHFAEGIYRRIAADLNELVRLHGDALKAPVSANMLDDDPEVQKLAAEIAFPRYQLSQNWKNRDVEVPALNERPDIIARDNIKAILRQMVDTRIAELHEGCRGLDPESPDRVELIEKIMACIEERKHVESREWFDEAAAAAAVLAR